MGGKSEVIFWISDRYISSSSSGGISPRGDWNHLQMQIEQRRWEKVNCTKGNEFFCKIYIFRIRRRNSISFGLYTEWNLSEIKREECAPNLRRRLNFRFVDAGGEPPLPSGTSTRTAIRIYMRNSMPFDLLESLWYIREMTPEAGGIAIRQEEKKVLLVCRASSLICSRRLP